MKNINLLFETLTTLNIYLGKKKVYLFFSVILSFISISATLTGTYLVKHIINNNIISQNYTDFAVNIILIIGVYLISILSTTVQTQIMIKMAYSTVTNIRKCLFSKLQKTPISYFDKNSYGSIMNLFTHDMENIQITLEQSIIQVLNNTLQIIGSLIMIFILGGKLIFITLLMTFIILSSTHFFTKISTSYFTAQQNDMSLLAGFTQEIITGHETIQLFQLETKSIHKFCNLNTAHQLSTTKAQSLSGIILPIVNYLNIINTGLTALFGMLMLLNGNIDIGSLTACIQLTISYNQPFKQISMQVNHLLQGFASANRIFSTMQIKNELDEGHITLNHNQTKWVLDNHITQPLLGTIELNNVTFSYNAEKMILQDISISAKKGQKIALVGSTGSGKTTIAHLINRFYEIEKGIITYDGIPIQNIRKDDLRRSIGVVFQDTHLFTGTILDNIRYGKLDASDEEVIQVAKLTQADHFISHLKDGYNTRLIRDGENLSVGQKQLISITRTALANQPVIILDESTSSIDTRTEALVNKGLTFLMQNKTVFIIAHKFSTIKNADKIYVLDQGKIIETGTHSELINAKGTYYQLSHSAQLS